MYLSKAGPLLQKQSVPACRLKKKKKNQGAPAACLSEVGTRRGLCSNGLLTFAMGTSVRLRRPELGKEVMAVRGVLDRLEVLTTGGTGGGVYRILAVSLVGGGKKTPQGVGSRRMLEGSPSSRGFPSQQTRSVP